MRLILSDALVLLWLSALHQSADAFTATGTTTTAAASGSVRPSPFAATSTQLYVSIGLGPAKKTEEDGEDSGAAVEVEKVELVAGVDYEIPDHEAYRTSRRSKLDEQCDAWFGALLGGEEDRGILGSLAEEARRTLLAPVPLVNDVRSSHFEGRTFQFLHHGRLSFLSFGDFFRRALSV